VPSRTPDHLLRWLIIAMTLHAAAAAATADRYHRHRSHFDLEPDETIEQYRATRSRAAAEDDDNIDISITIVSKRQLAQPIMQHNDILKSVQWTTRSMGHSSMNPDPNIFWKLGDTVVLVLGTVIILRWKTPIFTLFSCAAERSSKRFFMYRKLVGDLVHHSYRILAAASFKNDADQASNIQSGMAFGGNQPAVIQSTNGDRTILAYASPPSPMKRKCSGGGQEITPNKKTRSFKVVVASSTDQLPSQCATADHGSDFFTAISTPLPTDDHDHPSLLDETTIISVMASEAIIAADDLDGTICPIYTGSTASAQRTPKSMVHPGEIMHTNLVDAFSQIDKSSIQRAFENATMDALQAYASMTACTMLGVPSEVGAHLALQRRDSDLKEQYARDREIRIENGANSRAESTNAAIRESAPWIVAVHTARDQCLASVNNACVLGLAIAAIMFLCDVEYLTMEALSWKNWSWRNLTRCMVRYSQRWGRCCLRRRKSNMLFLFFRVAITRNTLSHLV
jgi:hypothetical protein